MALISTDWTKELEQVKSATRDIVKDQINPMIQGAIKQAGTELNSVVTKAGDQIEASIKILSQEVHSQRQLTRDDLIYLIDYTAEKLAKTIDDRMLQAKVEASSFLTEKISQLKTELEDAAVKSRKTLYTNVAISIFGALAMAVVGIIYKKISIGGIDIFTAFRVLLLSMATGTGIFSILKAINNWVALNKTKKNIATVAINHLSVFRPNGAIGLFLLALLLFVAWYFASFYAHAK